jgi:hypothetical protein
VSGEWKNVGTGFTTASGVQDLGAGQGRKYRSFATKAILSNDDVCRKAKSSPVVS